MRPPENLNIIHIYNLIIPLKPEKDCNFPVTVAWFEFGADQPQKVKDFYKEMFGWEYK